MRFMTVVKEGMEFAGVRGDVRNRGRWRHVIGCGNSPKEKEKEKAERLQLLCVLMTMTMRNDKENNDTFERAALEADKVFALI